MSKIAARWAALSDNEQGSIIVGIVGLGLIVSASVILFGWAWTALVVGALLFMMATRMI